MILLFPVAAICVGVVWHLIPSTVLRRIPSGWHAITLIPVFLLLGYGFLGWSGDIERWLFGGDIRVFLADYGINYDQRNALVVGLAMGFAVVPTIFTIAEDAIFSVPKHLSDGSLALGATQWQTLVHVVLLTASPGIFSAIMIGLGRAVGETMIVLMATGNTPIMDFNLFEGMRSLSATIAVEMPESQVGDTHYRLLFLAALLLFIFTFAVNSVAEVVRQRLRDRYRAM
jgi:phosphate transport system permease protein